MISALINHLWQSTLFCCGAWLITLALRANGAALRHWIWLLASLTLLVAAVAGAWVFGAYLALLTRLGLENTQAFTALDHPGFKHFVRLRVRADGQGIDGYCIGLVDPLHPDERPRLVDRFAWRPSQEVTPS